MLPLSNRRELALSAATFALLLVLVGSATAGTPSPERINNASWDNSRAAIAKLQILLDRAGFSPGVIDGRMGDNVSKAITAFKNARGTSSSNSKINSETWEELNRAAPKSVIIAYTIEEKDVEGPFTKEIPSDFEKQKELDRLAYTGPAEALAEAFHMDEDFLRELNPKKDFQQVGTKIFVANVLSDEAAQKADEVVVDKGREQVRLYRSKKLFGAFPATIGSEERPAPSGTLEVRAVAENPTYTYSPKLDFEGVKSDTSFTIQPGPNNPVGAVWIDLSKEGYGIHGTPEPAEIGKSFSHGCIRLTNWDAMRLAKMVTGGTPVHFRPK